MFIKVEANLYLFKGIGMSWFNLGRYMIKLNTIYNVYPKKENGNRQKSLVLNYFKLRVQKMSNGHIFRTIWSMD